MGKFTSNLATRTDMKLSLVIGIGVGVMLTLGVQKYRRDKAAGELHV